MSAVPKGVWTNRLTSFFVKIHEWKKLKKNCKARNAVIRRLVEAGAEGENEMKIDSATRAT
jgi:hypothetical protein